MGGRWEVGGGRWKDDNKWEEKVGIFMYSVAYLFVRKVRRSKQLVLDAGQGRNAAIASRTTYIRAQQPWNTMEPFNCTT